MLLFIPPYGYICGAGSYCRVVVIGCCCCCCVLLYVLVYGVYVANVLLCMFCALIILVVDSVIDCMNRCCFCCASIPRDVFVCARRVEYGNWNILVYVCVYTIAVVLLYECVLIGYNL